MTCSQSFATTSLKPCPAVPVLCLTLEPETRQRPTALRSSLGPSLRCCPPGCIQLPEPQAGARVRLFPGCSTGRPLQPPVPSCKHCLKCRRQKGASCEGLAIARGTLDHTSSPHTEGLCLLSSALESSSATASLEHCALSVAVSVLPRWDSMAHGVRTRPAMAVLTSSVGPEVPGPTSQLGLAPESGKEGISDSRRSAAESSFQLSQPLGGLCPGAGLCARAVGKCSLRSRTPSAKQLGPRLGTRVGAASMAQRGC